VSSALTVVLIAGNRRERAQRMLRSVLEQDIADQIVVMVYDRADQPARDLPELTLPNIIYEAVDKGSTIGQLRARATLAAATDIIAFIEEHVVVPPGWARESLRRHAEGYAGVTGILASGNSRYRWARIIFSITYGNYMRPQQAGDTTQIPGPNSSFIRSKILKFREELEWLLGTDILLIRRLVADGEKLYRAADLTLKHWNETALFDGCTALFFWNQMYICNLVTVEKWSLTHRALYLLATPLVPFVRALKNYTHAKQNTPDMRQFFADLPAALVLHAASAAGMAAGLLLGYQNSERKFMDSETSSKCWD
jgi:Glycosyl transferase family 2